MTTNPRNAGRKPRTEAVKNLRLELPVALVDDIAALATQNKTTRTAQVITMLNTAMTNTPESREIQAYHYGQLISICAATADATGAPWTPGQISKCFDHSNNFYRFFAGLQPYFSATQTDHVTALMGQLPDAGLKALNAVEQGQALLGYHHYNARQEPTIK